MNTYAAPYTPSYAPQQAYAPSFDPAYAQMQVWPQGYATGEVASTTPPPTTATTTITTSKTTGADPTSPMSGAYWKESMWGVPRWAIPAALLSLGGIYWAWSAGVFGPKDGARTTTRSRTTTRRSSARDPESSRHSRPRSIRATKTVTVMGGGEGNPFASGDPARSKTRSKKVKRTTKKSRKSRGRKHAVRRHGM